MNDSTEQAVLDAACRIIRDAGQAAADRFFDKNSLSIERKGAQDWVSEADKNTELFIRSALAAEFPDDGIIGEEHAPVPGRSGRTWVIDPIDGTSLYVSRSPGWVVTMAAVSAKDITYGVTYDPLLDECFAARRGGGAHLNSAPIHTQSLQDLEDAILYVGHSGRVPPEQALKVMTQVLGCGANYRQTGSGAQGLASVAAGRTSGYIESQMYPWDCLAGLLLIEEAGGTTMRFDMARMLSQGGPVIAAAPGIYDALSNIAESSFGD